MECSPESIVFGNDLNAFGVFVWSMLSPFAEVSEWSVADGTLMPLAVCGLRLYVPWDTLRVSS